jgi:hypothetical protein
VAGASEDGFLNVGYTPNYLRAVCVHRRALTHHMTPARLDRYDSRTGHVRVTPQLDEHFMPEVNHG